MPNCQSLMLRGQDNWTQHAHVCEIGTLVSSLFSRPVTMLRLGLDLSEDANNLQGKSI